MLSSQNTGKYVYGKWDAERQAAIQTADDADQTWLELSDVQVSGAESDTPFETYTTPVDSRTTPKPRDIRTLPRRQ